MDRSDDIALFRYGIVRAAADERLSKAERGLLVRALAAQAHTGPKGQEVQVSRQTIDRWVRAYRQGGYGALRPGPRRVEPRTPPDALELACQLRKEDPARSGAHIAEVLRAAQGWSPHPRALERPFKVLGLTRAALTGANCRRFRALPGRSPQRAVDRRRPARPGHRRQEGGVLDELTALLGPVDEREGEAYNDGGWGGIDLFDERFALPPPPPNLFKRLDGVALLYRRKIHYFYGAPETGKSFAAQVAVAWTLNDGGKVLYVDFENDPYSVRLVAVGVTWTGLDGLEYVNPSRPWRSDAERREFFSLVEAGADLVIVDGISNAMSLLSRSPLNHDDIVAFEMGFLRPLTRSGGAVVAVDHTARGRGSEGDSGSLFGGQHNKAAVTGASFYFKRVAPFGRGLTGSSLIMLDKDKQGWLRKYAVDRAVAEFVLVSGRDGSVEAQLNPPSGCEEMQ